MIGALTIQGMRAERERDFTPFGDSGTASRPTFDYVRAGDVARISLALDTAFAGLNTSAFRQALGASGHVRVVNMDSSGLGTVITGYVGNLIVDVQPLNDFAHLDDLVRYVAGVAQQAGLNVLLSSTRGDFVSKVEDTSGNVPATIPAPGNVPGTGNSATDAISNFFSGLTQSPTTLAVILGAAVILVIAAKK